MYVRYVHMMRDGKNDMYYAISVNETCLSEEVVATSVFLFKIFQYIYYLSSYAIRNILC